MEPLGLLLGALGLAAGGVLKGATGAGAPILAVPLLAIFYDVPTAVALFTFPNLLSNAWQGWTYRADRASDGLTERFAIGGLLGAFAGSIVLASASATLLILLVACAVFLYIAFRLLRPDWTLSRGAGRRLGFGAGTLGGVLQGAAGLSAPVSITFLNAMRLERRVFIATISIFFFAMSLVQIPTLAALGILDLHLAGLSLLACLPLFGAMPAGAWLARRLSKEAFDRIILGLLAVVALRLVWSALG